MNKIYNPPPRPKKIQPASPEPKIEEIKEISEH